METGMKSAREDAREDRREQGRKGSARGRGGGQGLVRKHYAALRVEMVGEFEKLFEKLSKINEAKK